MMNFALNDDQRLLKEGLGRLLQAESTTERVRAAEAAGLDPALWRKLVEFGIPTMRTAEAAGGGGVSLFDALIAVEEAGRALASAPVVEALVTGRLLGELGEAARSWLKQAEGGAILTLALKPVTAGQPQIVPAGAVADGIVALEGDRVVLISGLKAVAPAPNLGASPLAALDLSAGGPKVERQVLAEGKAARDSFLSGIEEWKLLTAAAIAALARQAIDLAAAYSRERAAFGRPVGSYQGLAHPLADMVSEVEGARLLAWRGVWAIAKGNEDAPAAASMAYWWAGHAARRALPQALRIFGGYGLCMEYDVQLYYRRGITLALLAGDPCHELGLVAERLWGKAEAVPLPPAGEIGIELGYGAKAEAYAEELRRFVEANVTPEMRKKFTHSTSSHDPVFHRKLAAAGYAFPHLPKEYGGQSRHAFEVQAAGPVWEDIGWNRTATSVTEFVALMILKWGTEEARRELLTKIAAGEALGALGFSEPQSGSDIFAAKFKAVREGDEWVLNGQKMFTTGAQVSDYIMMLTRTSSEGAKHQGLTMMIASLRAPGVEIQPVYTLQEERTNIVYFTDVRVHDRYRLGEIDQGFKVMQTALDIEHGGTGYHTAQLSMVKHAVAWGKATRADGTRPLDDPAIRAGIAKAYVKNLVADVLCRRADWADVVEPGQIALNPMAKLFVTESMAADAADLVALAAPESLLWNKGDLGHVELTMRRALGMTIYGGTSEIQRSIVAEHLLKMPKSRS